MAQPPQNRNQQQGTAQSPTRRNAAPWWLNRWTIGLALVVLHIVEPRLLGYVLDRLTQSLYHAFGDSLPYLIALPIVIFGVAVILYGFKKKEPPKKGRRKRH